jgi:hypothetical protein
MTRRKQRACAGPPKSGVRPYDNRPAAGPGRAPRRKPGTQQVRLVLPAEPPPLSPGAARALLRILVKAHAQLTETDDQTTDHDDKKDKKGAAL